jgi:hypothetical protein
MEADATSALGALAAGGGGAGGEEQQATPKASIDQSVLLCMVHRYRVDGRGQSVLGERA